MPIQNFSNFGGSGDNQINLYIKGLPPQITTMEVGNLFSKCGRVTSVKFLPIKENEFSTKAGFVCYANRKEADYAVSEFNGFKLGSFCLKVSYSRSSQTKETNDKNYQQLLKKLEQGPLSDADTELFLKKDNDKLLQKKAFYSQNNVNGVSPNFSHDRKNSSNYRNGQIQSTFSNDFCRSNSRHSHSANYQNKTNNHLNQKVANKDGLDSTSNISKNMSRSPKRVSNSKLAAKIPEAPCKVCGETTQQYCSLCSSVHYCSQTCQIKDWAEHSQKCHALDSHSHNDLNNAHKTVRALPMDTSKSFSNPKSPTNTIKKKLTTSHFFPTVAVGATLEVLVTDVDAENALILCQLTNENLTDSLTKLQKDLNEIYSKRSVKLDSPSIGDVCATIFHEDGKWYRAVIEKILDKQLAKVRFLDYGNHQVTHFNSLMQLNDKGFCKLPASCLLCKMSDIEEDSWTEKHLEVLIQLLEKSQMLLQLKCNKIVDNILYVSFFAGELSVNKALSLVHTTSDTKNSDLLSTSDETPFLEKSLINVKKLSESNSHNLKVKSVTEINAIEIPNKQFELLISFVINPNSFFCQVIGDNLLLLNESMQLITENINSKPKLNNYFPTVGTVCAAVFAEDDLWYRAEVLKVLPDDKLEVRYIDFGNIAKVNFPQVQPLSSEFFSLPIQAFEASLYNCYPKNSGDVWSDESINYLKNFAMQPLSATQTASKQLSNIKELNVFVKKDETLNMHLISKGYAEPRVLQEIVDETSSTQPNGHQSSEFLAERKENEIKTFLSKDILIEQSSAKLKKSEQEMSLIKQKETIVELLTEPKKNQVKILSDETQEIEVEVSSADLKESQLQISSVEHSEIKVGLSSTEPEKSQIEISSAELKINKVKNAVSPSKKKGSPVKTSTSELKNKSCFKSSFIKSFVPTFNKKLQISITCSNATGVFYCQVINSNLESLCESISELTLYAIKAPQSLSCKPVNGLYCAAYFDDEQTWNRAVVTGTKGNSVNVQFIDYGNIKNLSLKEVIFLPPQFKHLPSLALPCLIANLEPFSETWDEKYFQKINDCVGRELDAVFIGKDKNHNYLVQIPFLINSLIKDEIAQFTFGSNCN